jgi:hypothetical protein
VAPGAASEALHRALAVLGAEAIGGDEPIALPRGVHAEELRDVLRKDARLAGAEVYTTTAGPLLDRLRVFDGPKLLIQKDLRPWLTERPMVSAKDPPEVGLVVRFPAADEVALKELCDWRAPLAVAVPPFAPHTMRTVREVARAAKEVLLEIDARDDLAEQLAAVPEASGVLVLSDPPAEERLGAWLGPLRARDLFVLDGSAAKAGAGVDAGGGGGGHRAPSSTVPWLAVAARMGDEQAPVLARNLAVRQGHAIVLADASGGARAALAPFVATLRDDGYALLLPGEVARMHAGALSAGSTGNIRENSAPVSNLDTGR